MTCAFCDFDICPVTKCNEMNPLIFGVHVFKFTSNFPHRKMRFQQDFFPNIDSYAAYTT